MWVNDGLFDSNFVFENVTIVPQNDEEPQLTLGTTTPLYVKEGTSTITLKPASLTDADEIVPSHRNIIWMSVVLCGGSYSHNDNSRGVFRIDQSLLKNDLTESSMVNGIKVKSSDMQHGTSIERFKDILDSMVYINNEDFQWGERGDITVKVSAVYSM